MYGRILKLGIIYLFLFFTKNLSYGYTKNFDLRAELENDNQRVIPKSDIFAAAVDGIIFKNLNGDDYYHGNGYWVEGRLEAAPDPNLAFNLKLIGYNGASSYGYATGSYLHGLFGVDYLPYKINDDAYIKTRVSDLGRETLGVGLTLEEEEMNGGRVVAQYYDFRSKFIANGTGGYFLENDFAYADVTYLNSLIGVSYFEFIGPKYPPFYSVFSQRPVWNNLGYSAEVSIRNSSWAALASLQFLNNKVGNLEFGLSYAYRYYADKFGDDLVGNIEYDYLGYDIRDKRFTNIKSIFVYDDHVHVHSGYSYLNYLISSRWISENNLEVGSFDFLDRENVSFLFYKVGIGFYALQGRTDIVRLFLTNKFFAYGKKDDPEILRNTHRGAPPFFEKTGVQVEAQFRF